MKISPVQYWRDNKKWSTWLGKKGVVIASTMVRVTSPDLKKFAPYPFAVIDFGSDKKEFLGTPGEDLKVGDEVICVLRKLYQPQAADLIVYGLKIKKISQAPS